MLGKGSRQCGTFPLETSSGVLQVVLAIVLLILLVPLAELTGLDVFEIVTALTALLAYTNAFSTRQGSSQPAS